MCTDWTPEATFFVLRLVALERIDQAPLQRELPARDPADADLGRSDLVLALDLHLGVLDLRHEGRRSGRGTAPGRTAVRISIQPAAGGERKDKH